MRLVLVVLALLLVIPGFGSYRAFRYGSGKTRLWGAVPIAIVLLGGVLAPVVLVIMQDIGAKPSWAGIGGAELFVLVGVGSFLLAFVLGILLALSFGPDRDERAP